MDAKFMLATTSASRVESSQLKHLAVHCAFLVDVILRQGLVGPFFVGTSDFVADVNTKAKIGATFHKFKAILLGHGGEDLQ